MQIYYYRGEVLPLFYANLATLDLAERAGPSPMLAVAYTNTGAAAGLVPLRTLANTYFRLAAATLEQTYDPEVESYLHVLRARYLSGLGAWDDATRATERSMALATELGFQRRWDEGAGLRSDLSWGRDFDDSMAWCLKMYESAVRRRDAQATIWGHLRQAEVHLARARFEEADEELREAAKMPDIGQAEQVRLFGLRAFVLAQRGRLAEAVPMADRAARLVSETKTIHVYCIDPYARVAEVYLAALESGQYARDVRAKVLSACQTLEKAARLFPIAMPRYCLHEGTRRWLLGAPKAAIALWEQGHQAAIDLSIPHEEALLLLALVRHPTRRTRLQPGSRDRATKILAGLGVRPFARQPVE